MKVSKLVVISRPVVQDKASTSPQTFLRLFHAFVADAGQLLFAVAHVALRPTFADRNLQLDSVARMIEVARAKNFGAAERSSSGRT